MRTIYQRKGRISTLFLVCLFALLLFLPFARLTAKEGGGYAAKAEVAVGDLIEIERYEVDMTILPSRKVEVKERIKVKFLQGTVWGDEITMFYRSLPTDGARYEGIQASCEGNPDFSFDVVDNPDVSGFIDVECIGGVKRGASWTYDIAYTMEPTAQFAKDEMIIDVIGYGWSVDLHDVTAQVHFPASAQAVTAFQGQKETQGYQLSEDKKSLLFSREVLQKEYNEKFDETMAAGITLQVQLQEGALSGYAKKEIFTGDAWKLLLAAAICIAVAFLLFITRRRRELVTTVHIKPPKGMSPLLMGKIIDGSVNSEDSTSMIYYFAHKGYLKIDLTDEDDPELIRLVPSLPESCSAHEKTLFNGLFPDKIDGGRVKISKLVTKYYEQVEKAKEQVLIPKPMYEPFSILRFALGYVLSFLFAFVACICMGSKVGGDYFYPWGIFFGIPLALSVVLSVLRENYRYKWKPSKRFALWLTEMGVGILVALIFLFAFGNFFMTRWEKLLICIGALLPAFLTAGTLNRAEKYASTLEEVLGYKEFIVTTEEDKIEEMLKENPELYYEVLPYAQVLGVTKEWTDKFEKLTLPPPTWCSGNFTFFDYWLLNRCVTQSMMRGMAEAAMKSSGGGHIGRGGGGGHFGGFGGGGFGGGGGGAR